TYPVGSTINGPGDVSLQEAVSRTQPAPLTQFDSGLSVASYPAPVPPPQPLRGRTSPHGGEEKPAAVSPPRPDLPARRGGKASPVSYPGRCAAGPPRTAGRKNQRLSPSASGGKWVR